jgi:hypothetical protein
MTLSSRPTSASIPSLMPGGDATITFEQEKSSWSCHRRRRPPSGKQTKCIELWTHTIFSCRLWPMPLPVNQDENFHKGEIADSILLAMEYRGVKPNITTYGLAHKCWHRPTNGPYPCDKAGLRLQILKDKIAGLENAEDKQRNQVH